MYNILHNIRELSLHVAITYDLSLKLFFYIYLASIIPFYLGYFLILYGSTRNLKLKDIFGLDFKNKIRLTKQTVIGVIVHVFGRLMPYVYILFFGRNLPVYFYLIATILLLISIYLFIDKIYFKKRNIIDASLIFNKKLHIDNKIEREILWEIYNSTFEKLNKISPCKQSLDENHFMEIMENKDVTKYVLSKNDHGIIGICLTTNNFINTPWISEDYFKVNFPNEFFQKKIHYFIGLAIKENHRNNNYSISLIENVIDDLPRDAIIGFDHSRNINPLLHHFTRIVKQAKFIQRKHIDQQHYHVVYRKNQ